jgi:hypothetical protein
LLIFGYFRNRFIKYKKSISHFWNDSFLETIYSVTSSSNSWILDSMLIHLIRWFFLVKNFWIFVYGNFLFYFMNAIVSNLWLPVRNLENIRTRKKEKQTLDSLFEI